VPLNLKPLLADTRIGGKLRGRAFEHDAAVAHDVEPSGNFQRNRELLFHQQDRGAAARDFVEQLADLFDEFVDYLAVPMRNRNMDPARTATRN